MSFSPRRTMGAVCALLLYAIPAWCQSSFTASVRGVVTDSSGASVPGATVIITEAERNVPHTATTDNDGRYVLSALPPGSYVFPPKRRDSGSTTETSSARGPAAGDI